MPLFAVEYQDVAGRGVIAQGGLKFRASEQSLRHYFAPILPFVSLNDLIGETVFWILMPSTIAIWAFPPLLYLTEFPWALVWMFGLYILLQVVHLLLYIKLLNYVVFILGNKVLQFIAYVVLVVASALTGHIAWAIALAAVFLFYAVGVSEIFASILTFPMNRFVGLPTSDQLLRLIGWYYGRKYTQDDPTTWKMFEDTEKQG
jgi:hypothetical protein